MPLDDDPDFTFTDSGRCRMTISIDLGQPHQARINLEQFPADFIAAYESALESWRHDMRRTAGEMEREAAYR